MLGAIISVHAKNGFWVTQNGIEYNVMIIAVAVGLALIGAGDYSISTKEVITMQTLIYGPTLQAVGAFDGGKITEQKPIGFSGEGSVVKRLGPLFYWAWAHSKEEGAIGLHPHQAFEIMTYVISGRAEHGDTLGTRSTVGAGGVQLMQAVLASAMRNGWLDLIWKPSKSGSSRIWRKLFSVNSTYNQYEHEDFPITQGEGYVKKTVIGEDSPQSISLPMR